MRRLIAAEWFKIGRYWLPWVLLSLLIVITVLQVDKNIDHLAELEKQTTPVVEEETTGNLAAVIASDQERATWLRENLHYPAVIGYASRIATDFGLFFLILLSAVMGGEDFTRRTLPSILIRATSRGHYLIARCLALWLAAGVAVLTVTLLASIGGPFIHARVTEDPISLEGLGEALFCALRAWLICLPFIIATLFWAVLARHVGPAMGVGIVLHFIEFLMGFVIPMIAIIIAKGAEVPLVYRWQVRLFSISLGYNADVFLYWGSPFMKMASTGSTMELGSETLLPTTPWRAVAFLVGYAGIFLMWSIWIFRRRDVTYEG